MLCQRWAFPIKPAGPVALPVFYRSASASVGPIKAKALTFVQNGNPQEVLTARSFELPAPKAHELRLRFRLSPLNPADFNVLQGTYPYKPALRTDLGEEHFYISGNEGLAEVEHVSEAAEQSGFQPGDWVIMAKPQLGTWSSHANLPPSSLTLLPKTLRSPANLPFSLSPLAAATLAVNPSTAVRLLSDYGDLRKGDWVVQNGANSAVGKGVIMVAKAKGLKTVNFVRDRDDFGSLKAQLEGLGADLVLPYSSLSDKRLTQSLVSETTGGKGVKLALNCVSGDDTLKMARSWLGSQGHLVSYGAMSLKPLSLPTGLFIFKSLTAHGFNMTRWYETKPPTARAEMAAELVRMYQRRELKEVDAEFVELGQIENLVEIEKRVKEAVRKSMQGGGGKKLVLKWE